MFMEDFANFGEYVPYNESSVRRSRDVPRNVCEYMGIYRSARVHYSIVENPMMEKIAIKTALKDSLTFPRAAT